MQRVWRWLRGGFTKLPPYVSQMWDACPRGRGLLVKEWDDALAISSITTKDIATTSLSVATDWAKSKIAGDIRETGFYRAAGDATWMLQDNHAYHAALGSPYGSLLRFPSFDLASPSNPPPCRFCRKAAGDSGTHAATCRELPSPLQDQRDELMSQAGNLETFLL